MKFRYSIRTLLALVTGIAVRAGVPYLIPRFRSLRVSERYCGYYRGLGLDEGGGYFGTNWYRVVVDEAPNGRWEVEINGQEYAPYRGYYPTGSLRERGTCLVDTSGIDIFPDRTDVLDAEYYDPDGNLIRESRAEPANRFCATSMAARNGKLIWTVANAHYCERGTPTVSWLSRA